MEEESEKDYHEGHEPQFGYDHFEDGPELEDVQRVKRIDPDHPYCTNWPVTRKKKNEKV